MIGRSGSVSRSYRARAGTGLVQGLSPNSGRSGHVNRDESVTNSPQNAAPARVAAILETSAVAEPGLCHRRRVRPPLRLQH
jgi:hypothetical protein